MAKSKMGLDLSQLRSLQDLGKEINQSNVNTFQTVPIDMVISKDQVRTKFEDLEELAESIKTNGLQVPINVTEPDETGHYTIIQGERRWRACKMAGLDSIDVIVRKAPENETRRIVVQLTENIQRQDMDVFEVAMALLKLNQGLNVTEIAQRLGKSKSYVSRFISLSACTDETRELIERTKTHDVIAASKIQKLVEDFGDEAIDTINAMIDADVSISRTTVDQIRASLDKSTKDVVELEHDDKPTVVTKTTETVTTTTETVESKPVEQETKSTTNKVDNEQKAKEKTTENTKTVKIKPLLLDEGIHRVSDQNWRVSVEYLDEETGEMIQGLLATHYTSSHPDKMCVEVQGRILAVPVYGLTLLGMVEVNES